MKEENCLTLLPQVLLPWYAANKRELPWRTDRNPYHIWISEIMLQQTRVEAVKEYYFRFLKELPTVESLANASDELLYKLWEGLGYYSRVRNLKKAAQKIQNELNGDFPQRYEELLDLPGIGPYTAGAIASIAFDLKTPAVDGNVLRVFARLTNDATPIDSEAFKRKVITQLAEVYPSEAGEFTQAIMELGATICGPNRKPDCNNCPCCSFCKAFQNGTADALPVRGAKKTRKVEERTVLILSCEGEYALEKRASTGLLAGLWQFPNMLGKMEIPDLIREIENKGIRIRDLKRCVERKHVFTHIEWNMTGVYVEVYERDQRFIWFSREMIQNEIGLPTAFRQFWDEIELV